MDKVQDKVGESLDARISSRVESGPERVVCARCRRPKRVCYCAALQPVDNDTPVVILRHPRERKIAVGTAHMAQLSLTRAEVWTALDFTNDGRLQRLCETSRPHILYPGPDAKDVHDITPGEVGSLIVIDGTWPQAKKLLKLNPGLRDLPQVRFNPARASEYQVRRQPADHCVSTIEALFYILSAIEPNGQRFENLLSPFRRMVEMQVDHVENVHNVRRSSRKARRRGPKPVPVHPAEEMRDRQQDLVLVQGECDAWPHKMEDRPEDKLVHWLAQRVSTGEVFEAFIHPGREMNPDVLPRIKLTDAHMAQAVSWQAFQDRWNRFLQPSDVALSWGMFASGIAKKNGLVLPELQWECRQVIQRLVGGGVSTMKNGLEKLGSTDTLSSGRGAGASDWPPWRLWLIGRSPRPRRRSHQS